MSNVQRLTQYIGKTGSVNITGQAGIKFHVRVTDVRLVWNAVQLFCEPVSGSGGKWYAESSVEFHNIKSPEVNCPCIDPSCTHHQPIHGHTCREFAQQATGSGTLQPSGLCLHCHNAHYQTVRYMSEAWCTLVEMGWRTHTIDGGMATMHRPHASIPSPEVK